MNSNGKEMPKDRLLIFLKYIQKGQNKFEKTVGLANGNIAQWRNGNIPPKALEKILAAYPDLSKVWLLTGEGEMLKSERGETTFTMSGDVIKDNYGRVYIRKDTPTSDTATTNLSAENERLRQQVAELKADKAELQQTITTLRKALEKYI